MSIDRAALHKAVNTLVSEVEEAAGGGCADVIVIARAVDDFAMQTTIQDEMERFIVGILTLQSTGMVDAAALEAIFDAAGITPEAAAKWCAERQCAAGALGEA